MFGIEINFKDGSKDWIDPVYDEPIEKGGVLSVTRSNYTYDYDLEKIEKWFRYDLCPSCDHDVRTYDCTYECMKP